MTWRGTMRSINASINRMEREQRRKQRELERQRKEIQKMQELERAAFEVAEFENFIEVLQTVHREASDTWDWNLVAGLSPPTEPTRRNENESAAMQAFENYTPGLGDKLLRRIEKTQEKLRADIQAAMNEDDRIFQSEKEEFARELSEWQDMQGYSKGILSGDLQTMEKVLSVFAPYEELESIGTSTKPRMVSPNLVEAEIIVDGEEIVPKEQKTLLKSGKLSVKAMPISKFYEIYQDYVCSAVLRVARETFALIPCQTVLVTALSNMLNSATGHIEQTPILSVLIPKETAEMMKFDTIDPSDAMNNFIHRMSFLKTKGFKGVERIDPGEVLAS